MRLFTRTLAAGAVVAATVMAGAATAVADEMPPSNVEDFEYPQADKIFQERGIKLKSGDGHLMLATCDSEPGLIEIMAQGMKQTDKVGQGRFCFRVTGASGYLSLEIPRVVGGMGNNDYNVNVSMVTGAEEKSFELDKNRWTPIGKTADGQGRDYTLVEIVAKK
ncbi:hypothetical protein [Streptomyces abikoensis]|uniref:hypothetical protein n=1 Tax=Streptomyces abikoensis TaxID=97398 RepID=UPI001997B70C|nr:hypothetical protein [Streptomyces abikoensis]GGP45756.1 hypothetical protein GCM10010214_18460 [Streptomyces abikoensis]